jgi:transketolase
MALENKKTPTALILSRQNIKDLPSEGNNRFTEAQNAEKGAYIVHDCIGDPDVILIASGSEVATLFEGAQLLKNDNLKIRIVSAPSEGLFRNQPESYKHSVIPEDIPIFGLTAGLSVTLEGLVGRKGVIWGMNSFGYSAPYKILDEKLGFTGDNVYKRVKEYLAIDKG